jgi:hypothetical protein
MSSLRSVVRPFAAALAFAFIAAPLAASAEETAPKPAVVKIDKKERKGELPMKSEDFEKLVEERIAQVRSHVELALTTQPFPDSTKAQIRKDMDAGAETIRAAAKDAGKDGEVTAKEAEAVKNRAFEILAKARGKYLKPAQKEKKGS